MNDPDLRSVVISRAREQYGYDASRVEMRLYVGKFAAGHKDIVTSHLAGLSPPVRVVPLKEVVDRLVELAGRKTYTDDPVVMTVKALAASGRLHNGPPAVLL